MDTNTNNQRPEWLTDETIHEYKKLLNEIEPYTDEEVLDIPFDAQPGDFDFDRFRAYHAKKVLEKYGFL